MLNAGLNVTINTDDPSISGITLTEDYPLAQDALGVTGPGLARCLFGGARAAFLPPSEINSLEQKLKHQLPGLW